MTESTKQDVLRLIERMPEDASLEDILYAVYVWASVAHGLEDARHHRMVPHEEVMREVETWFRSAGDES